MLTSIYSPNYLIASDRFKKTALGLWRDQNRNIDWLSPCLRLVTLRDDQWNILKTFMAAVKGVAENETGKGDVLPYLSPLGFEEPYPSTVLSALASNPAENIIEVLQYCMSGGLKVLAEEMTQTLASKGKKRKGGEDKEVLPNLQQALNRVIIPRLNFLRKAHTFRYWRDMVWPFSHQSPPVYNDPGKYTQDEMNVAFRKALRQPSIDLWNEDDEVTARLVRTFKEAASKGKKKVLPKTPKHKVSSVKCFKGNLLVTYVPKLVLNLSQEWMTAFLGIPLEKVGDTPEDTNVVPISDHMESDIFQPSANTCSNQHDVSIFLDELRRGKPGAGAPLDTSHHVRVTPVGTHILRVEFLERPVRSGASDQSFNYHEGAGSSRNFVSTSGAAISFLMKMWHQALDFNPEDADKDPHRTLARLRMGFEEILGEFQTLEDLAGQEGREEEATAALANQDNIMLGVSSWEYSADHFRDLFKDWVKLEKNAKVTRGCLQKYLAQ